ncbi:hypothetical protein [Azospirillum himalayense]|uniref:Uncharacterized protein n=1 Tax=Azospirillum himalayense TaxID=654847 RepID=A0ABW0GAY0_9PROT
MTEDDDHLCRKAVSGSKSRPNDRDGGDHIRQAQEWHGGSKGRKGPIAPEDKRNPNTSVKS